MFEPYRAEHLLTSSNIPTFLNLLTQVVIKSKRLFILAPITLPRAVAFETAQEEPAEIPPVVIPEIPLGFRQSSVPKFEMVVPLLLFNDADTLLYIDPSPEDGPRALALTQTIPLRVHSSSLLTVGSAYFAKLFTPRYQKRARRQRGFIDKLPDGIKYLVDLTPAIFEEDAIITLTEVSCPMAIRKWASLESKWSLPHACVGGEDEYQMWERPDPTAIFEPVTVNGNEEEGEDGPLSEGEDETNSRFLSQRHPNNEHPVSSTIVRKGLPVEYSGARHREGIEHVLHVLEGLRVTLDTPCKLWTYFAVAKIFDVATLPTISEYITSWFYDTTNTRIIEIHPEIAYRVGCGIRSSALCRHAFVGLVSDEALLYLIRTAKITPMKRWQLSFTKSQVKDNLDDNEVQRIEYASKAFMDTMIKHFLHLAGEEMSWIEDIPECAKLKEHVRDFPEDNEWALSIIETLKESARFAIYQHLFLASDPLRSCDAEPDLPSDRPTIVRRYRSGNRAFDSLDCLVKLMGRSFWTDLMDNRLALIMGYLEAIIIKHDSIAEIGCGLLAFQGQENARIRYIPKETLEEKIKLFNQVVEVKDHLKRQMQAQAESANERWNLTINLRRRVPQDREPVASSSNDASSTATDVNSFSFWRTTLTERPAGQVQHFIPQQPSQSSRITLDVPRSDPEESSSVSVQGPASTLDVPDDDSGSSTCPWKEFDLKRFTLSANAYVAEYCRALLNPMDQTLFQERIGDVMTCLTDNEYQYLPLWAGGNDDGTGGVFTDHDIPIMVSGGFSAPGPQVHTGSVASTDDSFSDIHSSDLQSTVQGASHYATNSHTSDVVSVDSYDEVEHPGSVASLEQRPETMLVNCDYGYSVPSVKSDDEDWDTYSAGGSTIVMGSPELSGLSDDDMDITENDEDDCDMMDDLT
ncbi:hypothetical protein N7507_003748 [Penicillium longicatenatum]|nr:hypothetical protein N7507_003748 [Penicillium longicatenatum]